MRTMQLQHQTVLLAVLAASSLLLCSAADAAQPTAAAAAAEQPEASSSCRVAFPNTCVCQAGSCAGCAQCAGCPDSLCVAAPDVADAREWNAVAAGPATLSQQRSKQVTALAVV